MNNPAQAEPNPVEVLPTENVVDQPLIDVSPKPAEKISSPSVDPVEIERKLSAQFNYQLRQIQKQNKELADQLASMRQVKPVNPEKSDALDDFDRENEQVAQSNWQKAVDARAERIAEKKTAERFEAWKKEQEQLSQEQNVKATLLQQEERSKQKVLKEFPELLDENSETFKSYMSVFNQEMVEDPYFMNNPRKHEIVAASLRGKTFTQSNPEVERLKRVAAGGNGATRTVQSGNRIQLTQQEIDLCDKANIPYDIYAKNKKNLASGAFKEGMEIKS